MNLAIEIRPERTEDIPAIHALVADAFGRELEALVVKRLRKSDHFLPERSLVVCDEATIVGHVMITTLEIVSETGKATPTTILAPLAVAPSRQGGGIGTALTRTAQDLARATGHRSMILLGHPTYYPRFGFAPASKWGVRLSPAAPDEAFMAVELIPGGLENATGLVTLPSAFGEP